MKDLLIFLIGVIILGIIFSLWCMVSIARVRKEYQLSEYGRLCTRISKQIEETRTRMSAVKMQLYIADHALDQAILQWKYEYLLKQEQWLIDLMCGKTEDSNVQQVPEMRKETDGSGKH